MGCWGRMVADGILLSCPSWAGMSQCLWVWLWHLHHAPWSYMPALTTALCWLQGERADSSTATPGTQHRARTSLGVGRGGGDRVVHSPTSALHHVPFRCFRSGRSLKNSQCQAPNQRAAPAKQGQAELSFASKMGKDKNK